jgi:transposase
MNAVGIDVSKGKSTVAVVRPFGEIVKAPFDVPHTTQGLSDLIDLIRSLDGESRVVMENTGKYSDPIALALSNAGIFVCTANAKLIHNYGADTIRRVKTDKVDALKIAGYCLDKWAKLQRIFPQEETRSTLKTYNRQLSAYTKTKVLLKNNLISLTDQVFPGVNELFTSQARESDGHEKWIDFVAAFWHCSCIASLVQEDFEKRYQTWCREKGYHFSKAKATKLYAAANACFPTLPMDEFTETLITQAIAALNSVCEVSAAIKTQMEELSAKLPEYETVHELHGVGKVLGPQLMAEIGDVRRFPKRSSPARFAGIEPPENQSGKYSQRSRRISKQGSPHLRRALFQVMCCILQSKRSDQAVYQFMDRKRAEGKPYKVYMIAAANKFLRIYYARVSKCMEEFYSSKAA